MEFGNIKAFMGDRIRMCRLKRIGRKKWYKSARNRVEENMVSLYPLQKKRREDAVRGSKEGRKEKKHRMRKRKYLRSHGNRQCGRTS